MTRRRDLENVKIVFTYESISNSVPYPDPKGRLDKFMSPRVGNFTQKAIPDLIIRLETLGDTLDRPIITSFLAGVESVDQCLLNSEVLSCFSGVIMSIRSSFSF